MDDEHPRSGRGSLGRDSKKRPYPKRNVSDRENENRGSYPKRRSFGRDDSRRPYPKRNVSDRENENRGSYPKRRSFGRDDSRRSYPKRNFSDRENENRGSYPKRRSFDKDDSRRPYPKRNFSDRENENRGSYPKRRSFDRGDSRRPYSERSFSDRENENRGSYPKRRSFDRGDSRRPYSERSFSGRDGSRHSSSSDRQKEEGVLFGIHPVLEGLQAGQGMGKIFVRRGRTDERFEEILTLAKEQDIPVQEVPEEKLYRLARGRNTQGIAALITPITYADIETLLPSLFEAGKVPLLLLLDGITDVRNMGAIARSAECFGVDALLLGQRNTVGVTHDAVQASSGALLKLPVCRLSQFWDHLTLIKESGLQVVASTEKQGSSPHQVDFCLPTLLIMGAEGEGVSQRLLEFSDIRCTVPMVGDIGSLNVGVAAGVILYECLLQRQ